MNIAHHAKIFIVFGLSLIISAKAKGQDNQRQVDSLYGKIGYHLANDNIDSAIAVTGLLFQFHSENSNQMEMVRAKVHRAEILRDINSLELAYQSLKEVEDINLALEPSTVKSYYFNRLAAIEFERKNSDEAILAVRKSQEIDSLKNYKWRIFSNFNILGSIYRDREQWDKSVEILQSTYVKAKELSDTAEMNSALKNLAMAFYRMGDYRGAISAGTKYSETPWAYTHRKSISDNFRIIAAAYMKLEIFDSAYFALDSAHAHTLNGMQAMIDTRTDNYRVVNELEKQKLENSVLLSESENAKLQSIMLIITLLSIAIIAIILYRQRQGYKRLNAKQQELNLALEKSLGFKNQLIGIVAHDIRNPMSSLTGVIHLYNEGLINNDDLKDMMSKLEASAVSVNFLIENLLSWVLSQKQTLIANYTSFNLLNLINKTCHEVEAQYKTKGISLKLNGFDSELEIESDEVMLGLVIRNILSNAIKFSHEESEIIISYHLQKASHHITVIDFGVGIDKELLNKLKNGFTETKEGTKSERGTGLGLELSREFLNTIGASLNLSSEKGKGSKVEIVMPRV